ncbi:MAG: NAD(P)-dependent alcohol dehydrogenase, partial [Bacteroidota bacterium]
TAEAGLLPWLFHEVAMKFAKPFSGVRAGEIYPTKFKVGDAVFGETGLDFGGNAEFLTIAADQVVRKLPEFLSFESAALIIDGPLTSYNFLTEVTKLKKEQSILIIGASGSLGTAAVQIAKALGAKVTGVSSSKNTDFVRSLGADEVIAYDQTPLEEVQSTYDVVFDTIRAHTFQQVKHLLVDKGEYLTPVLRLKMLGELMGNVFRKGKKVKFSATGLLPATKLHGMMDQIDKLLESQELQLHIEKRFPLDDVVAAHQHIDTGRKVGNIVLNVYPPSKLKTSSTTSVSESEKATLA